MEGKEWVVPCHSLCRMNFIPPLKRPLCKRRDGSLHSNLDRLPRTQQNISNKFRAGRRRQVQCRPVLMGRFLPDDIGVFLLEEFVEAVFSGALERVADEGGTPTCKIPTETLCSVDFCEGFGIGFVESGIDLTAAFHLNAKIPLELAPVERCVKE